MAEKTKSKVVRTLDKKSMKSTKGGIIAVLKSASAGESSDVRKQGGTQTD